MPLFKPFRGIRPHHDLVETFTTSSIDNFTEEELHLKAGVDDSYVQMLKPFVCSKSKDVDRNLRKVRTNFEELLLENKLSQDSAAFYLYEQIMPDKTVYRGLLGLTSVEDFRNGKIKKHEATITQRKEKFAHYLEKVKIQAEPVLLTYPSNSKIEVLMNLEEKNVPVANFADKNSVRHKLWRIDNRLKLQQYKEVIEQIDSFYIADGHHRIGSAALNAKNHLDKGILPKYRYALSGSNAYEKATHWAVNRLKKAGADKVWLQPVKVPVWIRGKESLHIKTENGEWQSVNMLSLGNSEGTNGKDLTAEILLVKTIEEFNTLPERL
ncbi:hypothetical protein FQR65_LT18070 [Abscondita terminalis]|nr:hypothetical protein FQR65_LT18070 [Abscondita terminalis]